jgi:hypothetical protein
LLQRVIAIHILHPKRGSAAVFAAAKPVQARLHTADASGHQW